MYTIDEYRSSIPTYDIPHGAARECGRENIIRGLEAAAQTARSRRKQALQQFVRLMGAIIGISRRRPAGAPFGRHAQGRAAGLTPGFP